MSTYFSTLIKAGEKLREFNFKLASPSDPSRYSVDVPDEKGNRLTFSMYKDANTTWRIAAQLMPFWVHDAEEELAIAIEKNRELDLLEKKK